MQVQIRSPHVNRAVPPPPRPLFPGIQDMPRDSGHVPGFRTILPLSSGVALSPSHMPPSSLQVPPGFRNGRPKCLGIQDADNISPWASLLSKSPPVFRGNVNRGFERQRPRKSLASETDPCPPPATHFCTVMNNIAKGQ